MPDKLQRAMTGLASRMMAATSAAVGGIAVVGIGAPDLLGQWAIVTDGWILFFLITKPLWDLTWSWDFFSWAKQDVNLQTAVGILVLCLNAAAAISGSLWRKVPRRVSLFLASATLSVLFSPSLWGLNELVRLLTGVAFFYTAGSVLADRQNFDRFAKSLMTVCSIPVCISFLQFAGILSYTYWDWLDGVEVGRVSGGYETPLSLIYLFIFLFPLALYVANSKEQKRLVRHATWLLLVAMSVTLAFTYHRVGYLTIFIEVCVWFYLSFKRKAMLMILASTVIVAGLSFNFLRILYAPAVQSVGPEATLSSEQFLRGRGIQWYLYMDSYISSGPLHWVMGLGGSVIPKVLWEDPTDNPLSPNEPHNDYIRILHAYGLVGLSLYVSVLVLFWRRSRELLRSSDLFARDLARIMIPMIVGVLILSITTEPMRYPTEVWYLFGIGSALFSVRDGGRNAAAYQMGKS